MARKITSITGTRADYGLMTPVFRAIAERSELELQLIVTGMHLMPKFRSSLEQVRKERFSRLHCVDMLLGNGTGAAMAQSLGQAILGISAVLQSERPDILLLQGDRGEMMAGAIAAVHMNIPVVHMSGGDYTGSIDDSIRNAISKLSHIHLTTCDTSSRRLLAMGESINRIYEVGEPGLDAIKQLVGISAEALARELDLDLSKPIVLATQHPVTTESERAAWQMEQLLEALAELNLQTVFTYPNSDAGGLEMVRVLESFRGRSFLRIESNLGSEKYLSLMRISSAIVGNSSSGIFEAPSFRLPAVNIGTRQHGRLRAGNIVDVGHEKAEIVKALRFVLENQDFRAALRDCKNPYGDGNAVPRTVEILKRLRLDPSLLTKWIDTNESFLV